MANRPIYRKWYDPEGEFDQNYMMIHPNGRALQISSAKDGIYGEKMVVYQTSNLNPLNMEVFGKHKDVCSNKEMEYIRGTLNVK